MLRPNALNTFNKEIPENPLDKALKKIGGTFYTNCFTPAPDTLRSLACFWSGKLPKYNGCDVRSKSPRYFMDAPSFLDMFKELGYDFHFFIPPANVELGTLPAGYEAVGRFNKDMNIKQFLMDTTVTEKCMVSILLDDFHWVLDDLNYTQQAAIKGFDIMADIFDIIDDCIHFNTFDHVLVFSDHGYKLAIQLNHEAKHLLLNRDRTNIFMLLRDKKSTEVTYNNKLCCITDVYATICDLLGKEYKGNGDSIDLKSSKEHHHITVEDDSDIKRSIFSQADMWAVIIGNNIYYRMVDHYHFEYDNCDNTYPLQLDALILNETAHFKDTAKKYEVITNYYRKRRLYNEHSTGEVRNVAVICDAKREEGLYKKILKKIPRTLKRILKMILRMPDSNKFIYVL